VIHEGAPVVHRVVGQQVIRDRINKPLKDAGLPEIAGVGEVPDEPAPRSPTAPRPARRRR